MDDVTIDSNRSGMPYIYTTADPFRWVRRTIVFFVINTVGKTLVNLMVLIVSLSMITH